MSWLLAADELSPRGEGRGAAADEAAHLDAHKNRSTDLVRVKKARRPAGSNARGSAQAQ